MGNVHDKPEQRRSSRRFMISESSINPPSVKEPFLFAAEPKVKSKDIIIYCIYGVMKTMGKSKKTVAITDLHNVCTDISSIKRIPVDGTEILCIIYTRVLIKD